MKGFFLLKEIFQEGDYMCKIGLKDPYFLVPLNQKSQMFISVKSKDVFYQLRFRTSTKDIHKVDYNSHSSIGKTVCTTDCVFGRYSASSLFKEKTDTARETLIYLFFRI